MENLNGAVMMEEILYRFNPWWEESYSSDFIDRPKYTQPLLSSTQNRTIEIITGLRRIGKTSIMKIVIDRLINQKKIPPHHIFFVSLDFYKLEKFSILDIVEEYMKLHKIPFSQRVYLFLDEITHKKDFSLQLKNIYDLYNAKVFVSSSSASVLKDRKAYLTGRSRITEVLPLDFSEFLTFRKITVKKADKHLIESYFEDYMEIGGVPEYVLTQDIEYLKQLVDDILYKDIIAMHNVREKTTVKEFFLLLMERTGKQISLNRISKILDISVDTAKRFFGYFLDTYIVHAIERCGKPNERLKSPKKVYAGDVGIRNIFTGFRDLGAVFENLVFLKIKDKNPCYFLEKGTEIDFLTEDGTLIEVKYGKELNEKQLQIFNSFPAKRKTIIDSIEKYLKL